MLVYNSKLFILAGLRHLDSLIQIVIQFGVDAMEVRFTRGKSAILERSLTRPKTEVSVSAFALLFSEMVQYCQSRVYSVSELQARLADMGQGGWSQPSGCSCDEGERENGKRETKVLNILLFIKVLLFICFAECRSFLVTGTLHIKMKIFCIKDEFVSLDLEKFSITCSPMDPLQ